MKKILLAFVSLIIISSANAQQLTDSLLLYYPFNGNMNDASGNGFDATGTATLTQDRFGSPNSAYSFNGINETIGLPNQSALKPQLPVTYSYWVKINTPGIHPVIDNDNMQNDYNGIASLILGVGKVQIMYGAGNGNIDPSNRRSHFSSILVDDGSWHHVVCIARGATDMEIWIDCILDSAGTYSGTGGSLAYSGTPGAIGSHVAGSPEYLDGVIDDIRFWNRDITPAEIDSLCNEGSVGINELTVANPFTIYPNPTEGKFEVRSLELGVEKIEVYDLFGRLVLSSSTPQIDMRGFAKGMYFVKLGDAVRKLVIE